ncbi:putative restriction endonuclease [Rhodopirellula rubra]|uniref:Putative restriction endonuclease n=1 Tax=Aporhodopirellula rubra TaxID=980271 RepID=A0A7W5DUP0_9BACT|nr:HNH endonuclease [Aporhodopirellula rubra]MBB3204900.1 putative restriction endonuclease [Aporhodopirellula rubra]
MDHNAWLDRIARLNKARNNAPHKPLLLLTVLDLAEAGELGGQPLYLSPEIAFRFDTFSQIVAYRRTQRIDIRMPFHHLKSDGFWKAFAQDGTSSKHRSVTSYVLPDPSFLAACLDPQFREAARRLIIAKHFEPAERNALYHMVGLAIPDDDQIARDASFQMPDDAEQAGRNGRFRIDVAAAYAFTCALTGYRITTLDGGSIVDAAHIHQFADSRNNDPRNGLALSKNAHWLFDRGLWSIDDDYRVLVAAGEFAESCPDQTSLSEYHGERLRLPINEQLWPDPRHCRWHRKHRFRGSI